MFDIGTLDQLAEITMGQSPKGSAVSTEGKVPLLNGPTEFGIDHPHPVQFTNDPKRLARKGDLLFCVRGSTGKMNWADQDYAIGRGIAAIRQKKPDTIHFIKGAIQVNLRRLTNAAIGSVITGIKKNDLFKFECPIPDKKEIVKINKFLENLYQKIELNQKMNETLEEIAKTLFKSWFIDFDPVKAKAEGRPTGLSKEISDLFPNYFEDSELGKIPKGWKISSLEHFCESVRDGTHDSPKSSEVGEYLITTRNIVNGEIDLSNAYKISKEDYEDVNRRSKVDQWDVLISMIGTVGEVCLVREEPKFAIKNLGLFKNRSRLHGEWLYYFLKSTYAQTHLRSNLRGTTQLYIPLGELRDFPFFCPPEDILSSFGELTSVLTDKIGHNLNENQTLSELREILLPKLISGELKIPDVESLIEEASI